MIKQFGLDGTQTYHNSIEQSFPEYNASVDSELRMYAPLVENLRNGAKPITIRYKQSHVRYPSSSQEPHNVLPLIETRSDDETYRNPVGTVTIPKLLVSHVFDFPEYLAIADGFKSIHDMLDGISTIYKTTIQQNDLLSVYFLENFQESH